MANATVVPYSALVTHLQGAKINWASDTIKALLVANTYTPSYDVHDFADDLSGELSTGSGYTNGGLTLSSKTSTRTAANSWSASWAASTSYELGQVIRPGTGNGHLYRCIVAGTSGGSTPTFPTVAGQVVADNTVTWAEVGIAALVLSCAAISWTTGGGQTLTARYIVLTDTTPGSASTNPLICVVDLLADKVASNGGALSYTPDATTGLLVFPVR